VAELKNLIRDCHDRQPAIVGYGIEDLGPRGGARFIHWNVVAAIDEVMELMKCISWKPWSKDFSEKRKSKEEAAEEVADILLFVGNIAAALGVTDDDLAAAYSRVVDKVSLRARNGYIARTSSD
jgi:hypothetical protein